MYTGPNMANDGLVFYYDTGNTRKSFRGEPTVNEFGLKWDATNLSSWATSMTRSVSSQDSIQSPVGNTPLKMEPNANDSYTITYSNSSYSFGVAAPGETWTLQVWVKSNQPTNGTIYLFGANSAGAYTENANMNIDISPEWELKIFTHTFTVSTVVSLQVRLDGPDTYQVGDIIWWDGVQVEKKTHATPFTPSTRSATESLLDLTGNNTIDVTWAEFNEQGEIEFDVASITEQKYLAFSNINFNDGDEYSVENVIKLIGNGNTLQGLWGIHGTHPWIILSNVTGTSFRLGFREFGATYYYSSTYTDSTGIFNKNLHIACTIDATKIVRWYINGELFHTVQITNTQFNFSRVMGGYSSGGNYYPPHGQIPIAKIYNKALTPLQVKQNFNAFKSRFGIL